MIRRLFKDKSASPRTGISGDTQAPQLDPDLQVVHPALRAALDHYRSLCGGRDMPLWRDFSPKTAPPEALPHFLLLDVTPDNPLDYRWRLMGTHVYETLKRDTTGKTFADLYQGKALDRMQVAPRWVLERRRPLRTNSSGSFNRAGARPSENLFLPFTDREGRIVRIMLVTYFQPIDDL